MTRLPIVTIPLMGIIAMSPLRAGAASVETAAQSETVRREANIKVAEDAMDAGDKLYRQRHYDEAVRQYKVACDNLPDAPLTHSLRGQALEGFGEASVRLAEQRITEGRFEDAKAALVTTKKSPDEPDRAILDPSYNPNYKPAIDLLAHMEDPEWFNTTVGPKFEDKVHEVQRLFIEARGFYDSARYDLAYKRYDQILGLDPYNIAARKGQEMVDAARNRYADEAYNETRALLNWKVTKGWETAPRKYLGHEAVTIVTSSNTNNTEYIQNKLNHIIIPMINFRDATVRDAIEFLRKKSVELDTFETDPARKGVNIFLKLDNGYTPPPAAGGLPGAPVSPIVSATSLGDTKITLSLTNIPLAEALRYVTDLAGLKIKLDPYAVTIVPLSQVTENLITKEYKVPPSFLSTTGATNTSSLNAPLPGAAAVAPGGAAPSPIAPSGIQQKPTALEFLKQNGVQFPDGASANFLPSSSKLVVRNTEENMDLVDNIVDALNAAQPSQVNVESKFVEIQQTNYKELSYDYSVGTGHIGRLLFSGGNTAATSTTFPFTNITGGGQITSGLRSGGEAIAGNAIETLLNPSAATSAGQPAPATFALAGVVTPVQFQAIVRALNQRTGVDLLSAPSVTTKSGQRAVIEVVVEFKYPTEFEPPKVPNITAIVGVVGGGGGLGGLGGGSSVTGEDTAGFTPVTPTTPTAFETRNTGVTLEVEPVVGPDGETIDLTLSPQVVEFDGFVNYGSPIYGPQNPIFNPIPTPPIFDAFGFFIGGSLFLVTGSTAQTVITPNTINQPIFDTRKVTTSVSVWDGQTVIIGGLVREDVQTVQDKVPGLGDLPLIGRLFRSNVDQHTKRNLVMFVTAHLINPAGELVHGEEEKEEEVTPLAPPELVTPPVLPETPMGK